LLVAPVLVKDGAEEELDSQPGMLPGETGREGHGGVGSLVTRESPHDPAEDIKDDPENGDREQGSQQEFGPILDDIAQGHRGREQTPGS